MVKYYFFVTALIIFIACSSKENKTSVNSTASEMEKVDGAKIFKQSCEICHGRDGKLGANGSKDLTVSALNVDERIAMIMKGKGLMTPFENILSLAEIKAVAEYTVTLAGKK